MACGVSFGVTVPGNYAVDSLVSQIEGQTPRLEAIRNPDYGFGVIAACMDNGILKVMRVSQSSIEVINSKSGFSIPSVVGDIRFDTTGLFGNNSNDLFVTIWSDSSDGEWEHSSKTYLMRVPANGPIIEERVYGDPNNNKLLFMLDFNDGSGDYPAGAYLGDFAKANGTSFYHLDANYQITNLTDDVLPTDPNRSDLDPRGMEFDRTGNYKSYLTIADTDKPPDDEASAIYQLDPNLAWNTVASPVDWEEISYRDMCYDANDGYFESKLYVTVRENILDPVYSVMKVDPNGVHSVFASDFDDIRSITIDDTGKYMYVSDANAIYRIRAADISPGPTIIMQEPKSISDGVFTDTAGAMSLKLLWSEAVVFSNDDVYVEDEGEQEVEVSVYGSGTEFMIITFESPLQYDEFTITIHDTVVSVKNSEIVIDGDNDGLAGGDAVIVLGHRLREDSDNSNNIDLLDLAGLAEKWLWEN